MRKISLLSLLCLTAITSFGKTVDEATAKSVGANYLISHGKTGVKQADLATIYKATSNIGGAVVTDYYVFNDNTSKGFVIVSADDVVKPVLAYSTDAGFAVANMPSNIKGMLKNYEYKISSAIKNHIAASTKTTAQWENAVNGTRMASARTTSVAPLLATAWDQTPYYNAMCPYDYLAGDATVTGCVATATAQVMKFWNWPSTGVGSNSYDISMYSPDLTGILSANFGATTYDWADMPNSISSENDAIATLMYHVGVSVNMAYGTAASDGSGAFVVSSESPYVNCAEFALKNYFHYKNSLHGVARSGSSDGIGGTDVSETDWIAILTNEIDNSRPVIYSGFGGLGGHCWVCDGYDADNNFHMNWGWSGEGNGYYTVDDLLPTVLGTGGGDGSEGFNTSQAIIVGIQPDSFPSDPGNIKLQSYLDMSASPVLWDNAINLDTKIVNTNATDFTGIFSARIFDTAGNYVTTLATTTSMTVAAGDSTPTLYFNTTGLPGLTDGAYSIRIYYQATGTSTWTPVANNGSSINYTTVQIIHDFIGEDGIGLAGDISVPACGLVHGQPFSMSVQVANYLPSEDGGTDFNGTFSLSLYDITTGTLVATVATTDEMDVSPSTYGECDFYSSSLSVAPGTYIMKMTASPDFGGTELLSSLYESYLSFSNPVMVTVSSGITSAASITTVGSTTFCSGDSVLLKVDTLSGYTYQWVNGTSIIAGATSPSIEVSASGFYYVQLTDTTACPFTTAPVTVTANAMLHPAISITSTSSSIVAGTTVTFTAHATGTGVTPTYQWALNGTDIAGATTHTYTTDTLADGDVVTCKANTTYSCVDSASVHSNALTTSVTPTEGINSIGNKNALSLSPNPNHGTFTVKGNLSASGNYTATVEIVNMVGQVVYTDEAAIQNGILNKQINVSNLANGVYMMHINSGNTTNIIRFTLNK